MNKALIEEARRIENELRALRKLAEVVGDEVTEPGCPPQIRAAYIECREAIES